MDPRLGFMRSRVSEEPDCSVRWIVGIPVGTNPFFLIDLASFLITAWVIACMALLGLQVTVEGYATAGHLRAAARIGFWLDGVFAAMFLIAAFPFLKNRYGAAYCLEETRAHCENMRCSPQALAGNWRLRCRPWAIEPVQAPARSVTRDVFWKDVRSVQAVENMRTILLRGRWGTIMRIYCPDEETFQRALEFARKKSGGPAKGA